MLGGLTSAEKLGYIGRRELERMSIGHWKEKLNYKELINLLCNEEK